MARQRRQEMVQVQNTKIVGAAFSHLNVNRSASTAEPQPAANPHRSHAASGKSYNDYMLDTEDDWVTSFDDEETDRSMDKVQAIEYNPRAAKGNKSTKGTGSGHGLKDQYEGLVRDPTNSLRMTYHAPAATDGSSSRADVEQINAKMSRIGRFKRLLEAPTVDLNALRSLAWGGIPDELRPMAWQLLLGYLPANLDRRVATLARKRKDYLASVELAYSQGTEGLDQAIWHQIHIDVPRTNPHIPLYGYETTQRCLERILYVWALRHPASGYVQGINDLATPFFQVFLSAYIDCDPEQQNPDVLPKSVMDVVEADVFWCLTKLLDGIQENYIFAQPGIQRQVAALRNLTQRIDEPLTRHLQEEGVEFMQFSFRWMNCMLMRELSVRNIIRMWDTYMAEGPSAFWDFHLYVCAAFLVKWSTQLIKLDFQEVMVFLQALPTSTWGEKEIEILLSEAFMWQSLFRNASAHLREK